MITVPVPPLPLPAEPADIPSFVPPLVPTVSFPTEPYEPLVPVSLFVVP